MKMVKANSGDATATLKKTFPTLDHVWLFTALALIALRPMMMPIPPHDFWWHMATGRIIVETGSIPMVDGFSYTQQGEPFYNQSWLGQVMLYGIHSLGGIPLILLFQSAIITLAYGLLLWLCVRRSGALRISVAVVLLMLPLYFDNWNVRPQSYALPLFSAFLFIVTSWRLQQPGGYLWLLPILMALWVNIHGSFVLGGALMFLTFVGVGIERLLEQRRRKKKDLPDLPPDQEATPPPALRSLFLWGIVTAAAMLLNPRGVEVIGYVLNLLSTSEVTDLVTEWAPPTTRMLGGAIFFVYLMAMIAILVYAPGRPSLTDMLLAGAFFWLALGARRNAIWFAMLMAPIITVQLAHWRQVATAGRPQKRSTFQGVPAFNAILIGFLGLLLVLGLPWIKPHLGLSSDLGPLLDANTPQEAVAHLQAEPADQRPERLFHTIGYGSYLIWAAPEQPVFMDTRIELYPLEQWRDYLSLSAGNNVEALLEEYRIDGLMLSNKDQEPLITVMQEDDGWEVRYEDEHTTYLAPR